MEIRLGVLRAVFKLLVGCAGLIRQRHTILADDSFGNLEDRLVLKDAAVGAQGKLPHGGHDPRPVSVELRVACALLERRNDAVDPSRSLRIVEAEGNRNLGADHGLGIDHRIRFSQQLYVILKQARDFLPATQRFNQQHVLAEWACELHQAVCLREACHADPFSRSCSCPRRSLPSTAYPNGSSSQTIPVTNSTTSKTNGASAARSAER